MIVESRDSADESLWDWLRQEPALVGRVRHVAVPPRAGTLGTLGAVIVEGLITGAVSTFGGVLGRSLSVWLGQRRFRGVGPTTVTITVPGGRNVVVCSEGTTEVEHLVRLALDGGGKPRAAPTAASWAGTGAAM
ncbi:effector-associated constant component EACC1 [Streptomyces spectabilis]|uniref:Uncharacterized protein n=1 Tax=Streptomyces spectabilis TaxID=68270 RepID=A0A516R1X9_STRST|nr:hypothetical protein [Streptomyces spectabilis]QDQ09654.1 hypothetical protein FH965_03020 [Streptomyces spectabilis]